MDYIEKSANRECPGGLYGCAINGDSDMRCRAGAKYFLDKNALTDQAAGRQAKSFILASALLIYWLVQSHGRDFWLFFAHFRCMLPCHCESFENYLASSRTDKANHTWSMLIPPHTHTNAPTDDR